MKDDDGRRELIHKLARARKSEVRKRAKQRSERFGPPIFATIVVVGILGLYKMACSTGNYVPTDEDRYYLEQQLEAERKVPWTLDDVQDSAERIDNARSDEERRRLIHEHMLQDARAAVRSGQMSRSEFESYTGEKY